MVTKFATSHPMASMMLSWVLVLAAFIGSICLAVEIHPVLIVTMPAGFWLSFKLFAVGDGEYSRQHRQACAAERQELIDELAGSLTDISGEIRAEKFRNSIHDSMDHTEIKAVYTALLGC